ncbi:Bcr/CflA family drug resistance efflux transporter [Zafaria cholistanensis]|uniref:Bcr/CflA family drug resistance efflux transporter n=1 Tax=Zafaria cholistanensis TaxID=1682741 RepID=A0A5A7NPB4_9MICC|nr:multidrug effflux MFS transporter [Zafaria cholistanensis]GER22630.1 Bcr/CflA family drug resistance efflux transporter [Zafaria cholistanensis]
MPSAAPPALSARSGGLPLRLLLVLALCSMVGPAATDLYLPAFPEMARDLGVEAPGVQLTLTAFLLGMGAGQLFFGAVSDKYGRFRPLLAGLSVFFLASVLAALAPTLEILVAARLLQGLSAASGIVISRAIVADRVSGAAAIRVFSLLMTMVGVAPAVAPLAGSFISAAAGWRGVLWVLAGFSAVMVLGMLLVVRESHPVANRRRGALLGGLGEVAKRPRFLGYVALGGANFGVLIGVISASPFVYQSMMGFSAQVYGLFFGLNALGMMASGIISSRLAGRVPARRTLGVAVAVTLAVSLSTLVFVLSGLPAVVLAPCLFLLVSALGFVMGNNTGLALAEVRHVSGSGSALLGGAQFGMGALASVLVGLGGELTALPLAVVLTASSFVALCAFAATAQRNVPVQRNVPAQRKAAAPGSLPAPAADAPAADAPAADAPAADPSR